MRVVPIGVEGPSLAASQGTLLWIGDPSIPELRDAYQYCVRHAPQIALRPNAIEAARRPAGEVRWVVVARASRLEDHRELFQSLERQYSHAEWIDLLGPLCEGLRASSIEATTRVAWHRWDQVIPGWLGSDPGAEPDSLAASRSLHGAKSLAVLTSSYAAAQTYLDLAASAGVAAVWCNAGNTNRVRNLEAVWWDESVAPPSSAEQWRERVTQFGGTQFAGTQLGGTQLGGTQCLPRHAWITHSTRLDHREAAREGGVAIVISKLCRIDSLLSMLAPAVVGADSARRNRAA